MSLRQCDRCLYRDALVVEGSVTFCPVAESIPAGGDCPDFEEDDGRWDAAGTGGDA